MSVLRAGGRVGLFVLTTLVHYGGFVVGSVLLLPVPGVRRRWRSALVRRWARSVAWVTGLCVEVEGPPPSPPFLLVANHVSYMDVIVLLAVVQGRLVAKSEVAKWPVFGHLARVAGTLFIDRGRARDLRRVGSLVATALADGQGIVLFPEGTSTDGSHVEPFRPGLLDHAASARIPVHYAGLAYRTGHPDYPAETHVCWWGDMPFASHFLALFLIPRIQVRLTFGAEPVVHPDRKELARRLHREVCALVGSGSAGASPESVAP